MGIWKKPMIWYRYVSMEISFGETERRYYALKKNKNKKKKKKTEREKEHDIYVDVRLFVATTSEHDI